MKRPSANAETLAIIAFVLLLGILIFAKPALSHEWFTHKQDPVTRDSCCNGHDCKVLEEERWWRTGDNYVVRWFDGVDYTIPANQAQPSEDRTGKAAGCVWGGKLRCFFLPVTG